MSRLEFETTKEIESFLKSSCDLFGAVFQSLDFTLMNNLLKGVTLEDNVLLGCKVNSKMLDLFKNPIVFPRFPDLPFNPFRSSLYSPEELLGGYEIGSPESYEKTVDGATYKHYKTTGESNASDIVFTLARRLHDHAINDAL